MMKHSKAVFFSAAVGVLAIALMGSAAASRIGVARYEQHLHAPSEADLAPCADCSGGLCTHLPILSIETGGQTIPGRSILDESGSVIGYETGDNGEEEIAVSFAAIDAEDAWRHPEDTPSIVSEAMFRIRGNSSRAFDKSSYYIELFEGDPLFERSEPLLGMDPGSEWALHGPYLDKTLIRNYMWMNIGAKVMGSAPDVRFCELMLDGEYKGLYLLMETIEVGEGRTDIARYEEGDPVTSYMVRIENARVIPPEKLLDNYAAYTFRMEDGHAVEIRYPGPSRLTPELIEYVAEDLSLIERRLYSSDPPEGERLSDYLDMDSFVNYYILQEFLAINDTFSASTYFYKDVRGKLAVGPIWDYNNALDNFFFEMPADELILPQRGYFASLMRSPEFVERVIARYQVLRRGVLSPEYLENYVLETHAWLGSAIERNYEMWGYVFDPYSLPAEQRRNPVLTSEDSGMDPARHRQLVEALNPASFEDAVDRMLTFMRTRGAWLDRNILSLRQYAADSRNAAGRLD